MVLARHGRALVDVDLALRAYETGVADTPPIKLTCSMITAVETLALHSGVSTGLLKFSIIAPIRHLMRAPPPVTTS